MPGPDLSIVLCLHREGELVAPTLRSLAEAARFAQADGLTLELISVFDRADPATCEAYQREIRFFPCFSRVTSADFGSLGPARNCGVALAQGDYICLADGDDLVSFNFFSALYAAARAAELARVAIMPGVLLVFGETESLNRVPDLTSVGALNLLSSNPFVSRFCQRRDHALAIPFTDSSARSFYAFEDWRRHCDLVAAGFDLRTAPEAALFYRRRAAGLNALGEAQGAAAISRSPLFDPATYLRCCKADYENWRSGASVGAGVAFPRPMRGPLGAAVLAAARRLEPSIPAAPGRVMTPFSAFHKQTGALYYEICAALGVANFTTLFIGEGAPARVDEKALALGVEAAPNGSVAIEAALGAARIALRGQSSANLMLALKLAQSVVPNGDIHFRDSLFAQDFLARFGPALGRDRQLCLYASHERLPAPAANLRIVDPSQWPR